MPHEGAIAVRRLRFEVVVVVLFSSRDFTPHSGGQVLG